MTIRFCYGSSELKNYIENFQNFLEIFFLKIIWKIVFPKI